MTGVGFVLLVVGALIAVAEAHYPSHGFIGGLGVAAMAAGAMIALFGLGAGLIPGLLGAAALAAAGFGAVALVVKHGNAVRRRRVRTGVEGMIGHVGVVRSWAGSSGSVALDGALWRARQSAALDESERLELHAGDPVVVEWLSGLTLSVRPAEDWELMP